MDADLSGEELQWVICLNRSGAKTTILRGKKDHFIHLILHHRHQTSSLCPFVEITTSRLLPRIRENITPDVLEYCYSLELVRHVFTMI